MSQNKLNVERMKILTGDSKKRYDKNFDKIKNNSIQAQNSRLVSTKNGVKIYSYGV